MNAIESRIQHLEAWKALIRKGPRTRVAHLMSPKARSKLRRLLLDSANYTPDQLRQIPPGDQGVELIRARLAELSNGRERAYVVSDGPYDDELVSWREALDDLSGSGFEFALSIRPGGLIYLEEESRSQRFVISARGDRRS